MTERPKRTNPMATPGDELPFLADRQKTHGNFTDVATCAQSFKEIARTCSSWAGMTPAMREGIEMILHKLCRALSGNPSHRDHWDDVSGYAQRVAELIETTTPPDSLVAMAQDKDDVERCPHCQRGLRTRWKAGMTAVERAKRLHERQLQHLTQRRCALTGGK
jgi:hypothetical protein